ncbi:PHP domain-containing protein [Proteinivorax hydrogeniformans]|uniref:PHP domain-containing protein n=1 Tax=Proteinivorax hydrogeniformans TaxID=1826727 RepID=A0AAU8HWG1_9FIRM
MHIHSVLSPCADLSMGPKNIISAAKAKGVNIIGVTDHNSAKNLAAFEKLAKLERSITLLYGIEVETKEEIHVLCYFETLDKVSAFDNIIYDSIKDVKNNPDIFGDQVIIDSDENIIGYEEKLLLQRCELTIQQLADKVNKFDGMIIPAHIDRPSNGILTNLGFVPENIYFDAFEISPNTKTEDVLKTHPYLKNKNLIRSSDAHLLTEVGKAVINFQMPHPTFENIKFAFLNRLGRRWWVSSE